MPSRPTAWFRKNASQMLWAPIDAPGIVAEPLVPDESYFRLTLCEMFLARERDWFKDRWPAVHASVRLHFASEAQPVTFSRTVRSAEEMRGPGFLGNFELTPLLPYRGGTVELEAALTVLEEDSGLMAAFDVLSGFSALVAPPLSQALALAGVVADSASMLLESDGNEVQLALHESYVSASNGANVLQAGYMALLRTTESRLSPERLRVERDRLRIVEGDGTRPLDGIDYLLFRIDGVRDRPEWRFPNVEELRAKAITAHLAGNEQAYLGYRNAVLNELLVSPDLSRPDQIRAACALKRSLDEVVAGGFGVTAEPPRDLDAIVELHAPSYDEASAIGSLTLDELLGRDTTTA